MRWVLLSILALTLAGCAGYKLGPTNGIPAGSRSVKIQPFANRTKEPRVTEYVAISMRKLLQQDGTYRLETSGRPDIMVTGEITRFQRSGLSYQTNDVLTPQEYTLTLQARVVAVNVTTGKTNIDREVSGVTYILIGNDQSSAERQAIPLLADSLARNAVSLLVDGTW
jgi:Lipopolysaccharide-assembly